MKDFEALTGKIGLEALVDLCMSIKYLLRSLAVVMIITVRDYYENLHEDSNYEN